MDTPAVISGDDVPLEQQKIRYEFATLSSSLLDVDRAAEGIRPWVEHPDAEGQLLGAWRAEHGVLGRTYVLRSFVDDAALGRERARARASSSPFGAGDHLTDLVMNSYAPFPFLPPVEPGSFGGWYELRDYHLVPGGLPATIEGWRTALPTRHRIDPVTAVLFALDGPDRILQIWPFASLDGRVSVRRDLYAEHKWPPPGGPEHILQAVSVMAWPLDFSPLR